VQDFNTIKRRVMAKIGKMLAPEVTNEELEQAINAAIDDARNEMPYHIDPDESVTLAEDTYEYSLAGLGFAYIHRITMADPDGDFPTSNIIWSHMYTVTAGPTLVFDERVWAPLADRVLRIEGQAYQANLTAGTDVLYIFDAYIVNMAAGSLLGGLGSPREALMYRMAEDARQRSSFLPMPSSHRVRS